MWCKPQPYTRLNPTDEVPTRGDAPALSRGVSSFFRGSMATERTIATAASIIGPAWMYVTCPGCGQRIKDPISRLAGLQTKSHVNKSRAGPSSYCKVLIVVDVDFGPPRVEFITQGESIEHLFQREQDRLLALRKAREN